MVNNNSRRTRRSTCARLACAALVCLALLATLLLAEAATTTSTSASERAPSEDEISRLLVKAAERGQTERQREEAYQSVYEAFSKLLQNVSSQSLGSIRRLVGRLNQLVGVGGGAGSTAAPSPQPQQQQQQVATPATTTANNSNSNTNNNNNNNNNSSSSSSSADEQAERLLQKLDQVNKQTDPETMRQLNEDLARLVGSLGESYLRNMRRVIDRVERTLGAQQKQQQQQQAAAGGPSNGARLHQSGDRLSGENESNRQPGFPGFDELITAMDRVQRALANFVRSSTKLITAG